MRILGIDTSCDESCAAIIDTDQWALLSDVVHSHVSKMKDYGGVVPEIASREHLKGLPLAVHEALTQAQMEASDLDWIAVTHRPGLIGALLVGVSYAKSMAFALDKPFSVLDHIEAHLYSPLLSTVEGSDVPKFPWIALVVSGGHTELFLVENAVDYQWLGGTLDDAAGEAFDKIGKVLKFPYPAGPTLDKLVRTSASDSDRVAFNFPRSKVEGLDFSFSGLKTSVSLKVQAIGNIDEKLRLQIAASAQEAIVDALVMKLERACKKYSISQVVVTGGVACNSRLRQKLPNAHFPKPKHCTDNAAMVALLAGLKYRAKRLEQAPLTATAHARGSTF